MSRGDHTARQRSVRLGDEINGHRPGALSLVVNEHLVERKHNGSKKEKRFCTTVNEGLIDAVRVTPER